MRRIIIKRMTLVYFKGMQNLTIDFNSHETNIRGANGTGKTTIFDAFTWLLFGKDSTGRKDFNIKTLDADNNPIPRLPHEVTTVLDVDGDTVTLKKCFTENWTKKRGQLEEAFTGHSVECYYNDVPCSATEYNKKIAALCPEDVFRLITNPLFFPLQKKDYQRAMLFQLAGDVTNEDVLNEHGEFADLMKCLSGKTVEELRREVGAKKRRIKDAAESIPARIDERKRCMPQARDWNALEDEIKEIKGHIESIDGQMADRSKAYQEATRQKQDIARKMADVDGRIMAREMEMKQSLLMEYNQAMREHDNAIQREKELRNERSYKAVSLPRLKKELEELNARRDGLIAEWRAIKAEQFTYDPNAMVCPTCHRPLDADDIQERVAQMERNFNADHAKKLEVNCAMGKEVKARMEACKAEIDEINNGIFKMDAEIEAVRASKAYGEEPTAPDIAPTMEADTTLKELRVQKDGLQRQLNMEAKAPDLSDLKERRIALESVIRANESMLNDRATIAANNKRIAELEAEYKEMQAQINELDGMEYDIAQFCKARTGMVESRINAMFHLVKFKMYEQQINGGEAETCEATVDGVPFSDLNTAGKINAGLDIISAICRIKGIYAPIFIDNRESVTAIGDVPSQVINLIVDDTCKELKIQ